MQTYQDAIEAMLNQSIILPPELLSEVENLISRNRHLGYTTREEFIRDAVRWRLKTLSNEYETIEIPKDEFEELREAMKEMSAQYLNVTDFIYSQIRRVLEEYRRYKRERK